MLKTRPLTLTAALGLGVLMLAGCSGEETPDEPTTPDPVAEQPVVEETTEAPVEEDPVEEDPIEEEPEEEPPAPAGDGSVAAPGQTFSIGETARVGWSTYGTDELMLLDVTVESATEGNLDDLLALDLREDTAAAIAGHTPYYVDYTFVKVDPSQEELAHRNATTEIGARDTGGTKLGEFALLGGGFDTCESNSFGREIDEEGGVTTSCSIFLVPADREFGSVIWAQRDTQYADYGGEPLSWE